MYMIVGHNYWRKHEYDLQECLNTWLKDVHYNTSAKCVAFKFKDCDFKEVQMDGYGTLTWPKEKLVWRHEIPMEELSVLIKKLEMISYDLEEIDSDIYIKLEEIMEKLGDEV